MPSNAGALCWYTASYTWRARNAGSSGPSDGEALLLRDGRKWRPITGNGTGLTS